MADGDGDAADQSGLSGWVTDCHTDGKFGLSLVESKFSHCWKHTGQIITHRWVHVKSSVLSAVYWAASGNVLT